MNRHWCRCILNNLCLCNNITRASATREWRENINRGVDSSTLLSSTTRSTCVVRQMIIFTLPEIMICSQKNMLPIFVPSCISEHIPNILPYNTCNSFTHSAEERVRPASASLVVFSILYTSHCMGCIIIFSKWSLRMYWLRWVALGNSSSRRFFWWSLLVQLCLFTSCWITT